MKLSVLEYFFFQKLLNKGFICAKYEEIELFETFVGFSVFSETGSLTMLDAVADWMGHHLDKSPVLYSLGSQASEVVINHPSQLCYKCCMWVEIQSIST